MNVRQRAQKHLQQQLLCRWKQKYNLFSPLKVLFTLAICQKAGRGRQDFFPLLVFSQHCSQPVPTGANHESLLKQAQWQSYTHFQHTHKAKLMQALEWCRYISLRYTDQTFLCIFCSPKWLKFFPKLLRLSFPLLHHSNSCSTQILLHHHQLWFVGH